MNQKGKATLHKNAVLPLYLKKTSSRIGSYFVITDTSNILLFLCNLFPNHVLLTQTDKKGNLLLHSDYLKTVSLKREEVLFEYKLRDTDLRLENLFVTLIETCFSAVLCS